MKFCHEKIRTVVPNSLLKSVKSWNLRFQFRNLDLSAQSENASPTCAYLNVYKATAGSEFFSHLNPIPEPSVDECPNHFVGVKVVWESEYDLAGFV